jgi:hypothetical protein
MKSDKELRQLAKDVYNKLVYLSADEQEIERAFPILLFAKESELPGDLGSVYEYYNKASSMGTKIKPIFFSANFLTLKETRKVVFYLKEMEEIIDIFDDEDEETENQEDLDKVLDEMVAEIIPQLVEQGALIPDKNGEVEIDVNGLKELLKKCIAGEIDEDKLSELVTEMLAKKEIEEQPNVPAKARKVSRRRTARKKSK